MAKYELAYALGKTIGEIDEIPYTELIGWYAFLDRRPIGWREDNRAAVIAMSFGGGKVKPQDLFGSLKHMSEAEKKDKTSKPMGQVFFEQFGNRLTEKDVWEEHA